MINFVCQQQELANNNYHKSIEYFNNHMNHITNDILYSSSNTFIDDILNGLTASEENKRFRIAKRTKRGIIYTGNKSIVYHAILSDSIHT